MDPEADGEIDAGFDVEPNLENGGSAQNGRPAEEKNGNPPLSPAEQQEAEKENHGWRRIVRNFTPSWFSVTMGTGMVSILLHQMPYNGDWLYYLSIVVFCLNILLFALAFVASFLRYTLYPEIWTVMLRHPTQSLFLGTFPMGFATLINMVVLVCVPAWGSWASILAWVMWWIDAVVSVAICCSLAWFMISAHEGSLHTMTAVYLLPIVAPIVAAASGSLVAGVLENQRHALWTLIISYVMWGIGVPLAMMILVIYFHRLMHHKLPPREVIVSVFLPLGPLGQGGFGIMSLGKVAQDLVPKTTPLPEAAGAVLYTVGFLIGLIMWSMAIPWACFAIGSISRSKFPFNMGWWGFTFPIGTVVLATIQLGKELESSFYNVLGEILSATVVLLWVVVMVGTAHRAWTGEMFFAPCLSDLKPKPRKM